jgi:uncharacterized membrane protein YedE/YeeE
MLLSNTLILLAPLTIVFFLGYLAQTTGLCMVRGVSELKKGNPTFLLAILLSGILSWVAAFYAFYFDVPIHFKIYSTNIWIAVGGILFGLGTALNQGCSVSTLSKLARGDIKMVATILGWLVGWLLLTKLHLNFTSTQFELHSLIEYSILVVISAALSIWILFGDQQRKKLWFGMMGIGLLAGFLFLFIPNWPPSGLLKDLSGALLGIEGKTMPTMSRYVIFLSLITGMIIAAWRTKRFKLVLSNTKKNILHIIAGIFMGLGASLATGGNDSQLLLALPAFSLAGIVAVSTMLIGIAIGLKVVEKFNT